MTTAQTRALDIMAQNPAGIFKCTTRDLRTNTARAMVKKGLVEVLEGCNWFPEYIALTPAGIQACKLAFGPGHIPHPYTVELSRTLAL